ncbi:MAG: prepilin-type N-terminal cleavage/methylation domain-containing protein [Candidatus Taylorbacteria bacterium]
MLFHPKNQNSQNTRGMTLVETLVALSIFLVIMVAITTFEVNIFSYQKSISGSFDVSQSSQIVLKKISREMRQMSAPPSGAYPLTAIGSSTIRFFSDTNADGIPEPIVYDSVASFLYFDGNDATTTDISAVRFVRITIASYSAFVQLRNL